MARPTTSDDTGGSSEIRLPVDGMRCLSCVLRLESALEDVPGVLSASADIAEATATVLCQPGAVTREDIVRAVVAEGYRVAPQETDRDGPNGQRVPASR